MLEIFWFLFCFFDFCFVFFDFLFFIWGLVCLIGVRGFWFFRFFLSCNCWFLSMWRNWVWLFFFVEFFVVFFFFRYWNYDFGWVLFLFSSICFLEILGLVLILVFLLELDLGELMLGRRLLLLCCVGFFVGFEGVLGGIIFFCFI